ncbi:MAG: hypothetical protein ACR2RV_02245 [Verrucomicrobiales bacterium]
MTRIISFTIGLLAGCVSLTPAAQITINNLGGLHPITDNTGALVPIGSGFVQVGSIGLTDAEVIASPGDRAGLEAAFEEFGSAIAFGAGGSGGFFSASITAPIGVGDPLIGQNIYIVAGDGSDIASSDGVWIFKSMVEFDDDDPSLFSATISLDTAIEQSLGSVLVGTPVNTLVPLVGDSFDGSEMVAFIPEPDVASFAGMASLLMILRRSRRTR